MRETSIIATKTKADKLVKSIKRRKSFTNLDFMLDGECEDWFYYYQITGYFKRKYFSLDINCHKINNRVVVRIVNTTDCKKEIEEILEEFGL